MLCPVDPNVEQAHLDMHHLPMVGAEPARSVRFRDPCSTRTELIPFEVGSLHFLVTPDLRQLDTIPPSPHQVSNKRTTPRAPANTKVTTALLKDKVLQNIDSAIALALEGVRVRCRPSSALGIPASVHLYLYWSILLIYTTALCVVRLPFSVRI